MRISLRHCVASFAAIGLCLTFQSQVDAALVINLDSAVNNSTANTSTGTATDKREFNSLLTTIQGSDSSGVFVGSSVSISTRLAALTLSDKDSNTNTLVSNNTQNATVDYSLTFSIANPGSGVFYDLTFNALRFGELTVRNESTGHGGNATLTLGSISTSYSGPGSIGTGLNFGGQSFTSPNSNNANEWFHIPVDQSGSVTISGLSGAQTITLGFTWAQNANSANAGGLFSNGQGDDGAIRLGRATTTNADSGVYPGPNGRDIDLDGHFVNISARITAIPEPSSALLALTGLVGLVGSRRRRG